MGPTINPQDLPSWFEGKTIADLNAVELGGVVYIPDQLRRVNAKGEIETEDVMVKVPSEQDRAQARVDAIYHVGELRKWPTPKHTWTVEQCQQAIGAEVFENLDTAAIVARSLYERKQIDGKYPPAYMLAILISSWPPASWFDMFERLNVYSNLFNPRVADIDEDTLWRVMAQIARVQNVSPFGVMRGDLQSAFIVRMASECLRLRRSSSLSSSGETSTPAS